MAKFSSKRVARDYERWRFPSVDAMGIKLEKTRKYLWTVYQCFV